MAPHPPNFRDFLPVDGTDLRVTMERGDNVGLEQRVETTFSAEAVDIAAQTMQAWAISRLIRQASELGRVSKFLVW